MRVPGDSGNSSSFLDGVQCLLDCRSDVEDNTRAFSTIQMFIFTLLTEHWRLCFVPTSSAVFS